MGASGDSYVEEHKNFLREPCLAHPTLHEVPHQKWEMAPVCLYLQTAQIHESRLQLCKNHLFCVA